MVSSLSGSCSLPTTTTDHSFFSASKGKRGANSLPQTTTTTTVRVFTTSTTVRRPVAQHLLRSDSSGTSVSSYPPSSSSPPASDRSSPPTESYSSPPKKRKSPSVEVDVVGVSGTDSEAGREPKRKRGPGAKPRRGRKKGQGWSKPFVPPVIPAKDDSDPALKPIYRNSSRSRSSSSFPNPELDTPTFKRQWGTDLSFDATEALISSETVVKRLMKSYKAYFKNPHDPKDKLYEPHEENPPFVYLQYPNTDAEERFLLLAPKDKDHYNPILDLESTVCTLIEFYCTQEQQALFGSNPDDWRLELSVPASSLHARKPPVLDPPPPTPTSLIDHKSTRSGSELSIIRSFKKAIHTCDGPMFLDAMSKINQLFQSFKYPDPPEDLMEDREPNSLMRIPQTWTDEGMPKGVYLRIFEELYQRTVGPNVPVLNKYKSFSNTVYGELLPSLVDEIIRLTGLNENSLFLDLGSGVANVCAQASLQTGCRSFGIELMPEPSRVARDVVQQVKRRATMWGVRVGDIEIEEGDMLQSRRVNELMPQADVVLVDNKVFSVELNEKLKPKFLDLKEGAIVISLAPFFPLNAMVTDRNVDDMTSIFKVTEREYHSGSVSWGSGGGSYYIHRVDRVGYAQMREEFEKARAQMRPTRTRRS